MLCTHLRARSRRQKGKLRALGIVSRRPRFVQVVREFQVCAVRKLILVLVDECHGAFERIFAVGHGLNLRARERAASFDEIG